MFVGVWEIQKCPPLTVNLLHQLAERRILMYLKETDCYLVRTYNVDRDMSPNSGEIEISLCVFFLHATLTDISVIQIHYPLASV